MQRSIKKGVYLLTASIALFLTMSCANSANNTNSTNSTAAPFEKVNDADTQKAVGEKTVKKLRLYHQADWENGSVKIFWESVQNASRYHVVCIRTKDSQKILEQDISAQEETAFAHEIAYGEKYKYEVWAYQNDNGSESVLSHKVYKLRISPSPILWENKEIKTKKGTTLVFYPSVKADYSFRFISPTGIQIYCGKDKKHMKLVHTVKCEELSAFYPEKKYDKAKKYVDKNSSHIAYYQLRSYIDMGGKRLYGKKSEIKLFREEGYRGEVKARIKMKSKKQNIKNMEVIIKNAGKKTIKAGMPYIKNYYKTGKYKKKYVFSLYLDADGPIASSNDFKIDKIEYKSHASKKYKTLSKDVTVIIKPGEKMYLRFSRKNGQKFSNYFVRGDDISGNWAQSMNLYLFQYMGKKVFIRILAREKDGKNVFYAKMYNDESGEPYTYDLQDD